MELAALYQIFLNCKTVTTDSRNCPEGSLFIALKGDSFDGNAFAGKALQDGCAYAVVDEAEYASAGDERYILTENCLQTLQQLANYHRRQLGTRIIGITGTNGKTTTKELIAAVLSQAYKVLYTQGNLNNHIGVPLTLLRLRPEHQLAVVDMGANHPGEIKHLCEIAEPDYGIITNVGKAHLEGFGSFEGVIKTKGELYDFLRKKNHPTIFIHENNPYLKKMAGGSGCSSPQTKNGVKTDGAQPSAPFNCIRYGTGEGLYVNGKITANDPFLTFEWEAGEKKTKEGEANRKHRVQTQLIGEYNFTNAMAAIAIGRFFGVEDEKIDRALTAYTPQNNRSQLKKTARNTLVIDAYNANPTSMIAALENFRNMKAPHKMLLLGDMRELGTESPTEHQKIADFISLCGFETVWLVGEQFAAASHRFQTFADIQEVISRLQTEHPQGHTILIKGSNGIKLDKAIDYL